MGRRSRVTQGYLTVQALTKYIKRKFDKDPHLQDIYVKGEISNYKRHSSGHIYFTLKDDKARILAVMFSSSARKMRFEPENGMKVLIRGAITVFETSGQYQIYVNEMQPDGIGELFLAFEQLKEKLEKEGLFLSQHKKGLPSYPQAVGVVTSPTGAAIRDILTTIKRRYPIAKVMIYPALVQGNQAAPSIVNAIQLANQRKEVDVLIVARGGGSIEDLWPFNEESVARAIFQSIIPIVSGVGHETDTTIADFVSDKRAPTPTGAAEIAVPDTKELLERILNRKMRLTSVLREILNLENARLNRLSKSYAFRYPRKLYEQKLEHLDRTVERTNRILDQLIKNKADTLSQVEKRLIRNHPNQIINLAKERLIQFERRLQRSAKNVVDGKQKEYTFILQTLDFLSPLKIMERGYSLVYDENEHLIKKVKDVEVGQKIRITLNNGQVRAQVLDREEN